jgi:hypothetical protein
VSLKVNQASADRSSFLRCASIAAAFAIVALAALHGARAVSAAREAFRVARTEGAELVVQRGDVAVRDLPKAFGFADGRFFEDPHYSGEVAWYPFATPLLVAAAHAMTGLAMNEAYFCVAGVIAGLAVLALGGIGWAWAGLAGLVAALLALLAGAGWPSPGVYPYHTCVLPLTLYLLAATIGMRRAADPGDAGAGRVLAATGALHGLLALWHGASFVVASAISAILLGRIATALARGRLSAREAALRVAAFGIPFLALFALLVVPQLVHYGGFRQAEAARSYLEPYFAGGDDPDSLVRLALVPRGAGLAWLLAFGAALVVSRSDRARAVPLGVGWLVAKGLAHLGFVLHSTEHPGLASVARRLLVVPPHTLDHVGEIVFALIETYVIAVVLRTLGRRAVSSARLSSLRARFARHPSVTIAVACCAPLALGYAAAGSAPPPPALYARPAPTVVVRFAERIAEASAGGTVIGANGLIHMARIKVLSFDSPAHTNPYVTEERERALRTLERASTVGDRATISEVLRRYDVRLVVGNSLLSSLCGRGTVMFAPDGSPVTMLDEGCGASSPR